MACVAVVRRMRVVLTAWGDRSIAGSGIVVPILIFVVFEKVWVYFPDVYEFYVRPDAPKLERGDFDRSDERRTRDRTELSVEDLHQRIREFRAQVIPVQVNTHNS